MPQVVSLDQAEQAQVQRGKSAQNALHMRLNASNDLMLRTSAIMKTLYVISSCF
jgi:hypothetical protein